MPAARMSRPVALAAGLALALVGAIAPAWVGAGTPPAQAAASTADTDQLKTWWHDNHEFNTSSPVASDKVRRSSFYDVQVATAAAPT
ncbi:hypothetical protein AB0G02_22295, partial [Actinosynnema sp. NPDC023658]|uniref:hypothetical protein n=1 Tax=Actinosynnema sp. NPDC023658 TaxID=3155465 RepID=UPI0033F88CA6